MSRKKVRVTHKKERAILSDVLPYEIPITFSNKHFCDFLAENKVAIISGKIEWSNKGKNLKYIIGLMFGVDTIEEKTKNGMNFVKIPDKCLSKIPFTFSISHRDSNFRELSIAHPLNQLQLVNFYDTYKELILYHCNISQFSIRFPHRIARFSIHKNTIPVNQNNPEDLQDTLELVNHEDNIFKTYFVYEKYSNIYKFYESDLYHACEKIYDRLYKFDISKCFDSIYTHTITWATLSKNTVKGKITASKKIFAGKFDKMMQDMNFSETNGIIIGPEFSRIFAEIILQRIDKNVQVELAAGEIEHKKDYEIFRYVDDYFVFYNEPSNLEKILRLYKLALREYKLYVSDSKSEYLDKPLITQITIAKQRIGDLFDESFKFQPKFNAKEEIIGFRHTVKSQRLITRFKTIVKDTGIVYRDILNYTLACVDRRVERFLDEYAGYCVQRNEASDQRRFSEMIIETLEFTFFIYAVAPRVNVTVKLCMILSRILKFLDGEWLKNKDAKDAIRFFIHKDITLILKKHGNSVHNQVETLYLLIAHKQLGPEYFIEEKLLATYMGINMNENEFNEKLNYWSIIELLFYIENNPEYNTIKYILKKTILKKFKHKGRRGIGQDTELCLLFFDLIVCPFLDRRFINQMFRLVDIQDDNMRTAIINERKYWFTKWTGFDYNKEIMLKKSREVY